VIVSFPAGSAVVVIVAVPAALTVPDPSWTLPLAKLTEPVTPAPAPPVRVAVSVTDAPYVLAPEVVAVIEGAAFFTFWVIVEVALL
jgi:hypothetical protein